VAAHRAPTAAASLTSPNPKVAMLTCQNDARPASPMNSLGMNCHPVEDEESVHAGWCVDEEGAMR
jgi:hypothetical protein